MGLKLPLAGHFAPLRRTDICPRNCCWSPKAGSVGANSDDKGTLIT